MEREGFIKAFLTLPDYIDQDTIKEELKKRKQVAEEGDKFEDLKQNQYEILDKIEDEKEKIQKEYTMYHELKQNKIKLQLQKFNERI